MLSKNAMDLPFPYFLSSIAQKALASVGISIIFFFVSVTNVFPASLTLSWNNNSEPDLAGYKVYYGVSSGNYEHTTDVENHTSHTFTTLRDGTTYYFAVAAYDKTGNESTLSAEVSFYIPPENNAPVANGMVLSTREDSILSCTLSASDTDGDSLTYRIVRNPNRGTVNLIDNSTGSFTYTPNCNENGTDAFTFIVNDGKVDSNVATVTMEISPENDPPVASNACITTSENSAAAGSLGATDIDGDSLTYSIVSNGTKGTANLSNKATGQYTYTPDAYATGTDAFTFKANDGKVDSNVATITVYITPENNQAQIHLKWNANREPDIAGYKVYYGNESRKYANTVNVGNQTSYILAGLDPGKTYYVAITAYDLAGNEGEFSSEIIYVASVVDSDRDGIPDDRESDIYGTDPFLSDTDGDGMDDGTELSYWGTAWDADLDGDGLINLLDEDSDGDGYKDGIETHYGSNPADPDSRLVNPPLETGEVTAGDTWQRVALKAYFVDPVVIAKPMSSADDDPAVVRIRNVSATGFDVKIEEWDYLDGSHAPEVLDYVVMESGSYKLADGTRIEAGKFDTDQTGSFTRITFEHSFGKVPIVLTGVTSFHENDAVTTRIRKITPDHFDFKMQEQELNSQAHATEEISFIAWEPSMGVLNGLPFEVSRTGDTIRGHFRRILFNEAFADTPVFLADMQTTDGGDTATVRWKNKDVFGVDIRINEEQSRDNETNHTTEVVGYVVFSH